MEWVSNRDEGPDNLLNDFSARRLNQGGHFSPLVTSLLSNGTTPATAGEWPMLHVTRNVRNDFRYEFSLSAAPEFDTESADGDEPLTHDNDNTSTDGNQGTSTSEDSSLDIDVSAGGAKEPFREQNEMSIGRSSPVQGEPAVLQQDAKKPIKRQAVDVTELETSGDVGEAKSMSVSKSAIPAAKPTKVIQKKKSGLAAKKPAAKSSPTPNTPLSASVGSSAVPGSAPSHTKMCRDRLNNMFEQLRHTLPPAPAGVEVKHKAQVLDYAIAVLKKMVDQTSHLEIELAVSSNKATMDWISKLVNRMDSFPEAAEEVMKLFSKRRGWRHAELWTAGKKPMPADADPEKSIELRFCRATGNESMAYDGVNLDEFSKESESYVFRAKEGVQGRVWSSMRPEWVTGLMDVNRFRRAPLANKYGLKTCLAVPVTITGKIEAVMCFYDVKHRPFDIQCVELAMRLAWALGNAMGGKRANVTVLSTSGTSNT